MASDEPEQTVPARKGRPADHDATAGQPSPVPVGTFTAPPGDFAPTLRPAAAAEFPSQLGCYRLSRKLGEGGMGAVFLAEDLTLHRQVALKVIRPDVGANSDAGQRFLREARSMAALKHDNIVTIYAVGEDKGVPFLAMELLKGTSLEAFLKSGKPLTTKTILRIGREIARGLAVAHAKGLVHRDIKPANIWLEAPAGRVKILDFVISRPAAEAEPITASGLVVGTPHYMSPEQARGEKVDGRADLFSLGVLLYRLSTGQVPFQGPTLMSVLMAIGTATPKSAAEIKLETPPRLSQLIDRLIAKNREDRPPSADAVAAELSHIDKEMGRETALGRPAEGMVIDDVLPVSDHGRKARESEMTDAVRPAMQTTKAPADPAVDDEPEMVSTQVPKKKRKLQIEADDKPPMMPLVIGVAVFAVAVIAAAGWRMTRSPTPTTPITTQSEPTPTPKAKPQTPTVAPDSEPDEAPKTETPRVETPRIDPETPPVRIEPIYPPKKDFLPPKKDGFPKKDPFKKGFPS